MTTPSPLEQELGEVLRHYTNEVVSAHNFGANYVPTELVDESVATLLALIARHEQTMYREGYLAGFKRSSEGYNGEYPFGDRGASDADILAAILPPGAGEREV